MISGKVCSLNGEIFAFNHVIDLKHFSTHFLVKHFGVVLQLTESCIVFLLCHDFPFLAFTCMIYVYMVSIVYVGH